MKEFIRNTLKRIGFQIRRIDTSKPDSSVYHEDGLRSVHNHDFLRDGRFRSAYERGIKAAGRDYHWRWRVHVGLWVARMASRMEGDFVECGVNRGFLSSAIMHDLSWDSLNKTFFLLDTFQGLDERYVSEKEKALGTLAHNVEMLESKFYVSGVESVRANFSEWKNLKIIVGAIPETLPQVQSNQIAYLHLDMNCSPPEVAAAEYFWPKLVPGGFLLLDDYAYQGYEHSKRGMDSFAKSVDTEVLSLPTGQGLIIKQTKNSR